MQMPIFITMELLSEKEKKFLEAEENYPEGYRVVYRNRVQKKVDEMASLLMEILEKDSTFFSEQLDRLGKYLDLIGGKEGK